MAIGDFNGDGLPDLAVANAFDGTVSVLLGQVTQSATASLSGASVVGTGAHQIVARYGGDSAHAPSSSQPVTLTATPLADSLTLSAAPLTSLSGQTVTLQASLSPAAYQSLSTNGEAVSFYTGATLLGSAPLSNGVATFATTALPVGTDTLTAQFAGDTTFLAARSNPVTVTVRPAPDFTLTVLPPREVVPPAGRAGFVLALQAVNGFQGPVTLSCTGGLAGSYCVDFPQTVTVSNNTAYAVSGILFPRGTPAGTYTVTFQAVAGPLKHTATAQFTVQENR